MITWKDGLPIAPGDIFRVRTQGRRKWLARVRRVKEMPGLTTIAMVRINDEGDEFGKIDEMHLVLASPEDLVRRMQMDNYYGMVVPWGKAKKHISNQ